MNKPRIEQLFDQMLDEAPVMFTPKMKPYILEFARIYAKEVAEKSLEESSEKHSIKMTDSKYNFTHNISYFKSGNIKLEIDKSSITNPKNIILDI